MPTALDTKNLKSKPMTQAIVTLRSWDEAKAYFAEHLTPVAYGPKGQPIYSHTDIQNLNVELPEDIAILKAAN